MATFSLTNLSGQALGTAVGYGVGGAVTTALTPVTQAILNQVWPVNPNVPITPADAAEMVVQNILTMEEGARQAAMSGVGPDNFPHLYHLMGNPPGPEETLALWNRGIMTPADADLALRQSRLKDQWVEQYKQFRFALLEKAELAEMSIQDIIPLAEAQNRGELLGVHPDDMAKLHLLAGNPPGPEDTLSLYNRNIISRDEAILALKQSRLKPEWIDKVFASRIHPPTIGEIVTARVKEHVTQEEGARLAEENGISAATFDILVAAAGRPIGIMQALTLYNRGEYTKEQVHRVVAQSDVKTEYVDAVMNLAVRYPPLFQISRLLTAGDITDQFAHELIVKQGYPVQLADGIISSAHNGKTAHEKELTKNEIQTLYEVGGLSRDDAIKMIGLLGYHEPDANFILDLAEFRREARYFESVITRVHSQFIQHHIGVETVTTALDKLGVATAQREYLITLWEEERGANVRVLTEAQVHSAFHKNKLDLAGALSRLIAMGYSEEDANILLSL